MKQPFQRKKKVLQYEGKGAGITQTEKKNTALKKSSLFSDLSESELHLLAQKASYRTYPPHTIFIWQDEVSTNVFFIITGIVRIFRDTQEGNEVTIGMCGPGDVVGEMAVIRNAPRSANVETLQQTAVLEVSATDFSQLLESHPEIAIHLLKIFSKRLQDNNIYMEEVLSKNLQDRTFDILQSLGKYFPNNDVVLSQEELAGIVGATRSRVTEVLNTLELQGKISLSHRKIHLL